MALTAETIKHLEAAGLTKFFDDHRQLYLDRALKAYQYASYYVLDRKSTRLNSSHRR